MVCLYPTYDDVQYISNYKYYRQFHLIYWLLLGPSYLVEVDWISKKHLFEFKFIYNLI